MESSPPINLHHLLASLQDVISKLRSVTYFGRPDFDKIFPELSGRHPGEDIGVFFCGPTQLGSTLSMWSGVWGGVECIMGALCPL